MNWLATKHHARRDGESRSYRGRVAQRVVTMRGIEPMFAVVIETADCAGKPSGLQGLARGSPG